MKELQELLQYLQKNNASKSVIDKLERTIEARALRIHRTDTEEIQRFVDKQNAALDEKNKNNNTLTLMLLILLLTEEDDDRDEFSITDIFPRRQNAVFRSKM